MAKRHLEIRPEWSEAIRTGQKDIDARLVNADIEGLEKGDVVRYAAAQAHVRRIAYYRGFRDLLATEDWRRIVPDAADREAALRALEEGHPAGHSVGVVALELELLKK